MRCQILRLKCTKFDVGWGSAPDRPLGELTALPQTPAGFKGPYTSKERREEGRGGEGRERRGEREGREGKGREGRGREGREVDTPKFFTWILAYGLGGSGFELSRFA